MTTTDQPSKRKIAAMLNTIFHEATDPNQAATAKAIVWKTVKGNFENWFDMRETDTSVNESYRSMYRDESKKASDLAGEIAVLMAKLSMRDETIRARDKEIVELEQQLRDTDPSEMDNDQRERFEDEITDLTDERDRLKAMLTSPTSLAVLLVDAVKGVEAKVAEERRAADEAADRADKLATELSAAKLQATKDAALVARFREIMRGAQSDDRVVNEAEAVVEPEEKVWKPEREDQPAPGRKPHWWVESAAYRDALTAQSLGRDWLDVGYLEGVTRKSRNTVVKWMDRLVEQGFAERRMDPWKGYRVKRREEATASFADAEMAGTA